MGNTPSQAQGSPSRSTEHGGINHAGAGPGSGSGSNNHNGGGSKEGTPSSTIKSNSRHPSMRLPMPSRPSHISPNSSHPTSPSGRGGSPRRRKSLELPDLNKLSFTPAAVVATTATTTSHATHARHGDTLSPSSVPTQSSAGVIPGAAGGGGGGARKWQHVLGGRTASPLSGSLGPMSKVQALTASVPEPRSMPIPGTGGIASPRDSSVNPYFPSSPQKSTGSSPRRASVAPIPIPISGRPANVNVDSHGASPPPNTVAPTPGGGGGGRVGEQGDGLVAVPINWQGTAKTVYVTGSFADNWKGRIKLNRSTHDFNTILRLPPGTYQLKFIVDDSWRCSKQIPTATDDDGTLVNWIEVEASKTEEEIKAEWAMDSKPAVKTEVDDESQWTNIIPAPLVAYQYIEELPSLLNQGEWDNFTHVCQYMSPIPQPPALPRILDRVIVNPEPKRRSDNTGMGIMSPAGLDDNSILAVPNHVVLNHLTASAIKNGTLGVGTTTRYRKKYITTMFFKPTLQDLMDGNTAPPPGPGQPEDLGQPVPS